MNQKRIPSEYRQDESVWRSGRWILLFLISLLIPGWNSDADEFLISAESESNCNLCLDIPSLTSDYHLVSFTDALTNSDWALTDLVLGAEGSLIWRDSNVLARSRTRYYRVFSRPVSQPADSDNDGIDDVYELNHPGLLHPLDASDAEGDLDGDQLSNQQEYAHGTDMEMADTDSDGLDDYAEVVTYGTNPRSPDSDGDGMSDAWEVANALNPMLDDAAADLDGDGLDNQSEWLASTNPHNPDSDTDGLPDGWEMNNGFDPLSDGGLSYGLTARWTFDEGSGGIASNCVSPLWAGALRYMVETNWISGRGGKALWFDGVNDYVAVPQTGGAVVTGAPFTVTAVLWQDEDGLSAYPTLISDVEVLSSNRWPGVVMRYYRTQNWFAGIAGNTNASVGLAVATNWNSGHLGRWVDVALTHDGTRARLYVKGREVSSVEQSFDASAQPELRIGGGHANRADSYWRGIVDDLRIFQFALGTNELMAVNEWIGDADADGLTNGEEYELGTDPRNADTDGDGLSDLAEVNTHGTNPLTADSDGDGLPDDWELANGLEPLADDAGLDPDGDGLTNLQEYGYSTDPQNADPDGDGLNDYQEVVTYGTHPFVLDSDGDGLGDYEEVMTYGTNPLSTDTDSDAMPDAWEVACSLNPLVDDADGDPDGDGLTSLQEYSLGTHPNQNDSDGDSMPDGWELSNALDPLTYDADSDPDGDGLSNAQEYVHGTHPHLWDTDTDGMGDGWETANALDPLVDDAAADPDSDGLTNLQEQGAGTNPHLADTDGDGLDDDVEISTHGSDPLNVDTDSDGLPDGWEVAHSFSPVSDGGLAYGLEARWAFDEGAGSTASNEVSTNWPGLLQAMGDSNWTAGRGGQALQFDGVNEYVAVAQTGGAVVTGAPFTVTAVLWQEAGNPAAYPTVVSDVQLLSGGRWPGFMMRYWTSQNRMTAYAGNTNVAIGGMSASDWSPDKTGRWVDVALSHDGTRSHLFVDGREVNSEAKAFDAYRQSELRIGAGHVNVPDSYWQGKIDDLRIFRSALGTNELGQVNDWVGDADGDGLTNGEEYGLGTDPRDADTDDDGLSDYEEAVTHGTNPLQADSDGDGLPDEWEAANGLDPLTDDAAQDPDGDGLTNVQEYGYTTDPLQADTDGDGLDDHAEVITYGTDPRQSDTDGDGMADEWEVVNGLDPLVDDAAADADSDGLSNLQEYGLGTHPGQADTDSDGMPDGWEAVNGLNPLLDDAAGDEDGDGLSNGLEYGSSSDPQVADTDGDGLTDYEEVITHGTNPLSGDSDSDGLPDDWEVVCGLDPLGDDASADPDVDGLTNSQEYDLGTHPNLNDSDGDGIPDGWELLKNLDPLTYDSDQDPDGDGLTNAQEYGYGTHPQLADTDTDGMGDGWEVANALDPLVDDAAGDADGDGLANGLEQENGTNPQLADTDGDGLNDGAEVLVYESNPLGSDSDSDGLPDGWEVANSFSPVSDGGLAYGLEARWTFDEGAGSTASNEVSTNWPGLLQAMGDSNWIAGRGGQALQFDGVNEYVAVAQTGGAVVTGAPFTVTAVLWQEAGNPAAYPTVVSDVQYLSGGRWPGFMMRYWTSQNRMTAYAGNTNVAIGGMSTPDWSPDKTGRWVDVALSHDGTRSHLFVDGREVNSEAKAFDAYRQSELRIGAGHVNVPDSFWQGKIDDVRIFRSALGTTELGLVNDWVGDADGDGLTNGEEYGLGTDPRDADTDDDGLSDYEEAVTHGSNPLVADSDGDGLPDEWEAANGLDPLTDDAGDDPDSDGLTNGQEYGYTTDPQQADTDGDGLDDHAEVITYGTDPLKSDTDEDGLPDEWEVSHGLDPLTDDAAEDGDSDGLTNAQEYTMGTHPNQADTDSDGMPDGWEEGHGLDPLLDNAADDEDGDGLSNVLEYENDSDPQVVDTDGDGLNDYEEVVTCGTNPLSTDTDSDAMPDAWEVACSLDPLVDDASGDPDSDGLTSLQEYSLGTHPNQNDSDGDSMPDGWELSNALDPLTYDADSDPDGDGLSNAQEYVHGTHPHLSDTDTDGMGDGWETANALDPLVDDAAGDADGDGLTNLEELGAGTNPQLADTDGDGLDDDVEISTHGSDPLNVDTDSDGLPDGWEVAHSFSPVSDGGLAYGLEARWAFDEGAGSTASNEVSTNWPGLLQAMGDSNWTAGRGGQALQFDGVNEYVAVAQASGAVVTGAPFTVTAVLWQEAGNPAAYPTVVSDAQYLSGGRWPGFMMRYWTSQNRMTAYAGNTNVAIGGMSAPDWSPDKTGRWVDVAVSHDGTRSHLFVNGREVNSEAKAFDAVQQGELRIGAGHVNVPDSYWQGKIDDVRIFRSALGTNELGQVNDWVGDADGDGLTNGEEYGLGTDPRDADTDDDGLSDYEEAVTHGTNPLQADSDGDGIPDEWEAANGLDPLTDDAAQDPDGDGLSNLQEYGYDTDPQQADTDGDGLDDDVEVNTYGTDPRQSDTDGDGMADEWEVVNGLDPLVDDAAIDAEPDGLMNLQEQTYRTNPADEDTDADGMPDGWEVNHSLDPLLDDAAADADADGLTNLQEYTNGTDPQSEDTDGDGLSDYEEVITHGTNPLSADSDSDGLPDSWEVDGGLDPLVDDASADPDVDGLTNSQEYDLGTHPDLNDSDGDGMPDGWEVTAGLNPLLDDAFGDPDTDGLSNLEEYASRTDPFSADTDGDTLPDNWEVDQGLDPLVGTGPDGADGDPDGDTLTNLQEFGYGTDPLLSDSDGDGLDDKAEIATHGSDPLNADTDSDGLPDGWEVTHSFDPVSDGGLAYGLEARWAFDEGAGSTASNEVSTNWPGLLQAMGDSNWTAGRGGQALQFDGVNEYVTIAQTGGAVVTGAPFTVTAVLWQEAGNPAAYPTVVSDVQYLSGGRWPGFMMRYWTSQNRMTAYAGNTNVAIGGMSAPDWSPDKTGRWVDVAISHDGTRSRLFVDGREVNSEAKAFDAYRQSELRIGAGHVNVPDSFWQGKIDDVRIFRSALGTTELGLVNDWVGDADGDGLTNGEEYGLGTDPRDADTDDDGLSDYEEAVTHGSNPLQADTDSDGLPDDWEVANGLDPLADDAGDDPDSDGLTSLQEYGYSTDPQNADPDGDGLNDYQEVVTYSTDPFVADSDGDGLNDYAEVITNGTDPWNPDSDSDGLPDLWEVNMGLDPLDDAGSEGASGDPDGDGLSNLQEYQLGTHPKMADTDQDGLDDEDELSRGTDPLNEDSDADGLADGWEVQYAFSPLSGMESNLELRCWLQFDEGAGTSLVNSAQTGYSAVIRSPSGTQWGEGISGSALWLDGTNGYVAVLQPAQSVVTDSTFTVCGWFLEDTQSTATYATLFSDSRWAGSSYWPGFMARLDRSHNALYGLVGSESRSTQEALVKWWNERWQGRWTHVALVQDGAQTRLYLNGSLWAEASNEFEPAGNSEVRIGRGHVNVPDSGWRGKVDDFRIYGTALTPAQLRDLYDAQGDANSDGTNNLQAFTLGLDPHAGQGEIPSEGSIDIQFVPDADWTTNEPPQYLARLDDSNPGGEIHLFVEDDDLAFLLMDADGNIHSIHHPGLVGGGYLMTNATNRITASWRGFNTGRQTAEMRLFVNGLDYQTTVEVMRNPRLTSHDWEQDGNYRNAAFVQADWNTVIHSNQAHFGSWADGVFPLKATLIDTRIHATPYGMVSTNPIPPFELQTKSPPVPGSRPQSLIQSLKRPRPFPELVSSNEMRVLIQRYHQAADAAEYNVDWFAWGEQSPDLWDIMEYDIRSAIEIGIEEGFDVAISSWINLNAKICRKYPSSIPHRAERLHIVTNGTEARVVLTNAAWYNEDALLEQQFDVADRTTVSNYLDAWKTDLSRFSEYSYFFFNEDALQSMQQPSYLYSPTCSTNGLAWFREYTVGKYGTAYSQIRFPIHPLALGVLDGTNEAAFRIVVDDSITNRVEITTDPDLWAKWWEWRQVVFANLMEGYTRQLNDLNSTNTHWRGAVHFISPFAPWSLQSGVNMPLLNQIPGLDWIVMENQRTYSYGTTPDRIEDEVQLQLEATKQVTSTNTGFGSYVMAHTYPYPEITNGVTNATYNITWMTQDMAYAAAPEFQSSLIVPCSASLLVNRPGFTSIYQNAHYVPEVADAWSRERFSRLWSPLQGHAVSGDTPSDPTLQFTWDAVEQAQAYEWELSDSADHSVTNLSAQTVATSHTESLLTDPMPVGQPLYWRVRGVFHVLAFDDSGTVTGTNVYHGAWAAAPDPVILVDSDGDQLPDSWEFHYFGHLDWSGSSDPDSDAVDNLDEYLAATNPAP